MIQLFHNLALTHMAASVPKANFEMNSLACQFGEEEMKRIISNTGVERVRKSSAKMTASDLCQSAAEDIFLQHPHLRKEIDALVFVSPNPDYLVPATSPILQFKLDLRNDIPCFDINYGCSGYIYALFQAALLISSQCAKKVLLLTGETTAKVVNPLDRSTFVLFGDAGAASVVEFFPDKKISITIGTDGKGYKSIIYPSSAFRISNEEKFLQMNGLEVLNFVSSRIPGEFIQHLKFRKLETNQLDFTIFHQANKMIVEYLNKKLKLGSKSSLMSLQNFGNTGCPSLPLTCVVNREILASSARSQVMMAGFGVGLSWGTALVDLSNTQINPLIEI